MRLKMTLFKLNINGNSHHVEVEDHKPLLWVLRDELNLTGSKYGCGIGQCGACTVLYDGSPVRACVFPVSQIGEKRIVTIEGLAEDKDNPLFKAWSDHNVPQCGFCQSGQIIAAHAMLRNNPKPSDEEIDKAMSGNFCRCGTYLRIRNAIKGVR